MAGESLKIKMPGVGGKELSLTNAAFATNTALRLNGSNGKFVSTFETRRNWCTNPSFEVDTSDWLTQSATLTRINDSLTGLWCGKVQASAGQGNGVYSFAAGPGLGWLVGSRSYTASAYVKADAAPDIGKQLRIQIVEQDASNNVIGVTAAGAVTLTAGWQRLSVTRLFSAGGVNAYVWLYSMEAGSAINFRLDSVLIEESSSLKPYFDGTVFHDNLGNGYADPGKTVGWRGTAGKSISDKGCFANGTARTFSCWIRNLNSGFHYPFSRGSGGDYPLRINGSTGDVIGYTNGFSFVIASGATTTYAWMHLAVVYDEPGDSISFYRDGTLIATVAWPHQWSSPWSNSDLQVGSWNGNFSYSDVAHVAVHRRALSSVEILALSAASEYEKQVLATSELVAYFPLSKEFPTQDRSGEGLSGSTSGGVSTVEGPIPQNTVWHTQDFDLDNPVPRDVFVADADRDGSRPMAEPRWENRQPSFGLRMASQATADEMLAKLAELDGFLSAARRVAKQAPVDPADYVRLVWTPQDSTKSYFIPLYGGYIEGIDRSDTGWALKSPKVTVQMTADPAGYGAWATFLAQTNLNLNFVSAMAVPAVSGDLPPWAKVTVADAAGVDRGLVRVGVRQNDNASFFQINGSAITVSGYDSAYTGGFVQFGTWTDGRYRAIGAVPSQTAAGKFRVYALACRAVPGTKLRFSYATKNGSRRRLDAVDIGTGANSGGYYQDFFLGEINVDQAWDSWLETNGLAGVVWGLVFLPVDSFLEVVGPASGENLAGQSNSFDEFTTGTTSTHISGRTLNGGGGTWSTSGTNVASPTWPVSALLGGTVYADRQNVSAAAPGFARAGTGSIIDGSFKTRISMLPLAVLNDGTTFPILGGLFARWANITNFIAAAFVRASDTTVKPCLALCIGGTYYALWTGASILYNATVDIELQLTTDGRWWVRYDELNPTTMAITASQQANGSHAALRSGAALGGATAGHGLFDWKPGSNGHARLWHFYRQRALMGVTPLPLLSNKNIAWNDAVLMVDNNAAEYPYAGASGVELRPGVINTLNLMVRRNAGLNDSPGWVNDTSTNIKVEGYPRFLTVPQ